LSENENQSLTEINRKKKKRKKPTHIWYPHTRICITIKALQIVCLLHVCSIS